MTQKHPNSAELPMHMRYIRLDKIREAFAERYAYWHITLPECLAPRGGIGDDYDDCLCGWDIACALGHDEDGAPCLYVADNHRMTSPSFYLLRENGATHELDSYDIAFSYNPDIEGDHDHKEQEYYRRNRRIASIYRLCGVGGDYNYYASMAGEREKDGEAFFDDDSPFSLWHPCSFRAFGLNFHSAGQHYEWLRATRAGLTDLAETFYAAAEDDPACATLRTRCEIAPADIYSRCWEIRQLYDANRYKFQQNEDLRVALCATSGRLVYASGGDDLWGRTAGTAYEREEKGNCLGAALSLLRRDLLNEREHYNRPPQRS
jgi:predicted NAD-dependent protein-ADP-ribosyltransferase YbiA (DUF1768 family)